MICAVFETCREMQDLSSAPGKLACPRSVAKHIGDFPVMLGARYYHHRDTISATDPISAHTVPVAIIASLLM
jgi:hypothetical protein